MRMNLGDNKYDIRCEKNKEGYGFIRYYEQARIWRKGVEKWQAGVGWFLGAVVLAVPRDGIEDRKSVV